MFRQRRDLLERRNAMITDHNYCIYPGERTAGLKGYTLSSVFREAVNIGGEKSAALDDKEIHSWHNWSQEASALARALQEIGVSKGDVVALHLPNSWEYLTLHVAVAMIGAVTFPLHMAYGEHELRVLLEQSAASVLIFPSTYAQRDLLVMGR